MGQILIVTHRDGTTFELRRRGKNITNITEATQDIGLNGNDTITLNIESTDLLPFALGDTISIGNMIYTLNMLPSVTKTSPRHYKHIAVFEGLHYLLLNTAWLMPFSALNDTLAGNLSEFANQIVANLNRVYANTWEVGEIKQDTETKVLCYFDTNCLDVLQNICEEWDAEFYITKTNNGKYKLSIVDKIGTNIDYVFRYGAGGGLYDLQRNGVNDADFGTRIYFYGGSSNIPNHYFNDKQSSRLCLPDKTVDSAMMPTTKNSSYIEQSDVVNLYGRIERTKVFDDIYPNRIGKVTAIDDASELKFSDATMFNLNETDNEGNTLYLISGTTAKIHFNTGALAGYDFDIKKYDHATHTFTIDRLQDENNYVFPSENNTTFRFAIGDEYIITDITLPTSYVVEAEQELQKVAQDWYEKHCAPNVEYNVTMDEFFLRKLAKDLGTTNGQSLFNVGDTINVADTALWSGIKQFRIISLQRDLTKEHSYTLQLAITDEHRRRYLWQRIKKEKQTQTLFDRLGFTAVAYSANRGFELHKQNRNTSRLLILYDDDTRLLRPGAIGDSTIVERMVGVGAISSKKIADGAVTAVAIEDGAITRDKIKPKAIDSTLIADGAVTAVAIENGAITRDKIKPKAIDSTLIADGAVTAVQLSSAIRNSTERITSQLYYDNTDINNPHIVVSAGNYINSMLEDKILNINDQIISTDIEGGNIQSDTDYYIYIDKESNNVCVSIDIQDDTSRFIHIGLLGKSLKSDSESAERAIILRVATTEPQDYVFRDEKGKPSTIKIVSKIAETAKSEATTASSNAKSALNKANNIETIVGKDANSGLRHDFTVLETQVNNEQTGLEAMKEAINLLKNAVDGLTYTDCQLNVCKTLKVGDFRWEN